MTATIAGRVARGAALLDEMKPGWDARVDLAELDLSSCRQCVVGQLFGEEFGRWPYETGLRALGIPFFGEDEYGFEKEATGEEYAALTAEWRRVVTARRLAMRPAQETAAAR
jgi:hypothetical protein